MFIRNSADVKCDKVKKLLFVAILATSCTQQAPKVSYITQPCKDTPITILPRRLKIGDVFYFGYAEDSPSLFRVVAFNNNGVFAVWNFQSDNGDPHWFPLRDVYGAKNFKLLTK